MTDRRLRPRMPGLTRAGLALPGQNGDLIHEPANVRRLVRLLGLQKRLELLQPGAQFRREAVRGDVALQMSEQSGKRQVRSDTEIPDGMLVMPIGDERLQN